MSELKISPTPWTVKTREQLLAQGWTEDELHGGSFVERADGSLIAELGEYNPEEEEVPEIEQELDANARLMAAAPDLFEAAVDLDEFLSRTNATEDCRFVLVPLEDLLERLRPLRAAMHKAQDGEQP